MKKVLALFALLCVLFNNSLIADDSPLFLEKSKTDRFEFKDYKHNPRSYTKDNVIYAPEKIIRPYDVISYNIFLDWYDPFTAEATFDDNGNFKLDESWNGIVDILLVVQSDNIETIEVDGSFLTFEKVYVNDIVIEDLEIKSFEKKEIPLIEAANDGDTIKITIEYEFSGGRNTGFLIYPKGYYVGYNNQYDDTVFVEERVAYTHNEPQDARFWVPCNDHPHDKALFTTHIRLPKGYNVVSNGLLTDVYEFDLNSDVFTWKQDYPMSTYLLAVNASKFYVFNDMYNKVTNPEESIEVVYYVWEKDFLEEKTNGSRYNARHSFRNMVTMLEKFSEFFVEYPFEKYGMVAVQPYGWGGMEHQSITTINRSWLRGRSDGGIAHELVHQWFGDMITCDSWQDLWINEGAATWGEALWNSFWGGESAYNQTILSKRWGYLYYGNAKYTLAAYDVPSNQLFSYPITYCKSSWIYHMLYKMLGEDAFKQILRNMLNEYAYQPISSEQFIDFVKESIENPPLNLIDIVEIPPFTIDEYFDQWLYHPGHPIYDMTVDIVKNPNDNEKYDVNITMEQIQDFPDVPELFKTPIRFEILENNNGKTVYHYEEFYNENKIQTFTTTYDFIPDTVLYDFTYALAEVDTTYYHITSVENDSEHTGISIYPNPIYSGNELKVQYHNEEHSSIYITIFDMLGNIVYKDFEDAYSNGYKHFRISTQGFSSGVYNMIISSGDKSFTRKFTVVK